jgi:transposase-like protein
MKVGQPVSSNGNRQSMSREADPQVVSKAERRKFSAEYKLRILAEADECTGRGTIGALLRREGLYASHLDKWRKQREQGALAGLRGQKRGRKPDPQAAEIAQLQRENEQLRLRLERAEHIIDVQKKLAQLLGTMSAETSNNERL